MKTLNYTIKDELGLHARPAGMLAKEAMKFQSSIKIGNAAKTVDAKRIMGIMGLCVKCGDIVTLLIEGPDENEAFKSLESFLTINL